MEPNSNESVQVFCAETAMSIFNLAPKFAKKEFLYSNSFFCERDPCPVIFKMQMRFGQTRAMGTADHIFPLGNLGEDVFMGNHDDDDDDVLDVLDDEDDDSNIWQVQVQVNPLSRNVFVKRWNFSIDDNHGNNVLSHGGDPDTEQRIMHWFGGEDLPVPRTPAADVVWICTAKIYYKGCSGGATHMSADLLPLVGCAEYADITFLVGDEEIKAHKGILFARSKYFAAMFRSKLMEVTSGKIKVTDEEPKVFRAMLEYLYGGLPPKQLDDVALDLFVTADKYGIDELRDICELNLRAHLNADNVVDALLLAEQHNLQDLMAVANVVFRANRDVLMQSEENREKLTQDPDLLLKLI